MTLSTDTDIMEDDIENTTPRSPGNPTGINVRYVPPTIKKVDEPIVKFARNGSDPKENIKKFY